MAMEFLRSKKLPRGDRTKHTNFAFATLRASLLLRSFVRHTGSLLQEGRTTFVSQPFLQRGDYGVREGKVRVQGAGGFGGFGGKWREGSLTVKTETMSPVAK